MNKFLQSFDVNPCKLYTLADLMQYTQNSPKEMYDQYGMKQWVAAEEAANKFDFNSNEYQHSLARRLAIGRQLPELLDRYQCDILVAPASTDTTANYGGCPTITVPMGSYPSESPISYDSNKLVATGPNVP